MSNTPIRLDLQASYDFTALIPVENKPVPGYSKDSAKNVSTAEVAPSAKGNSIRERLLNGTVITVGCNNLFDDDPPFASGEGGNGSAIPASPTMPLAGSFTGASRRSFRDTGSCVVAAQVRPRLIN